MTGENRLTAAPKVEERITDSGAAVVIMFTATIPFHRMSYLACAFTGVTDRN